MEIHSKYFEVRVSLSLNYLSRRTKYNRPLAQRSSRQRKSSEKIPQYHRSVTTATSLLHPDRKKRPLTMGKKHNYSRRTSTLVGTAAITTVVYMSMGSID